MIQKQSYKDKMEQKRVVMAAAGLVSERYPGVSSIELRMTYYQRTVDPVLMRRTVSFSPANYACFRMDCMRDECSNGGFDLTPVITGLVKNHKTSVKGNIACQGKTENLGHNHASIAYEVSVEYCKSRK